MTLLQNILLETGFTGKTATGQLFTIRVPHTVDTAQHSQQSWSNIQNLVILYFTSIPPNRVIWLDIIQRPLLSGVTLITMDERQINKTLSKA